MTTDPAVDADDPVLWADRGDPSRALWIGTDKSDGLYVHSLDGTVRQFFPDGPLTMSICARASSSMASPTS